LDSLLGRQIKPHILSAISNRQFGVRLKGLSTGTPIL